MPRRIFDPLHRCNSGGVPAFSSSARAGAAASAAARGLGFLSLFVSSSTQASRLMHLSKHGGSLLGGIMRIISSRAPAATGSRGVSHRPARCGRLLLCSEHGSRGGAGPCEVGNDSSSNQDNRIRRRRRGGLAPRAQNLPLHHSRSDSRTRNRRTSGSVGGPWWGTGALMSTSTSAGDPSAAAAAADSGDGVAAGAGDRTAEGASGEGVAGPGEGEEQRRRVEGMVSSISPSAIAAFKQCPQLFYYRYILRLRSPPTLETLKGTAVHEVLSLFFTLDEESRSLDNLHELFRKVMTELIAKEKEDPSLGYSTLFESREKEKQWVVECLDLLANFVTLERESGPDREGDPEHLEFRMTHAFGASEQTGDDRQPLENAAAVGDGGAEEKAEAPAMSVVGIVDRIDRCSDGTLRVVDYKTGKVPNLKYPEATNKRIMDDTFFQLQIYALLVQRVLGEIPGEMRLVYLKGSTSVTRRVDPSGLPSVESELQTIWDDIALSVKRDDFAPRTSRLCDWCNFKDRCPAFGGGPG